MNLSNLKNYFYKYKHRTIRKGHLAREAMCHEILGQFACALLLLGQNLPLSLTTHTNKRKVQEVWL
jgi:hypothetical protein